MTTSMNRTTRTTPITLHLVKNATPAERPINARVTGQIAIADKWAAIR
jgi:hypothetical protein